MALTPKQKINATRAYMIAYRNIKKDESARVNISKLLTNANIAADIEKRMKDREQRTQTAQDRVLQELAKIGFADVTDFVTIEGRDSGAAVKINPQTTCPATNREPLRGLRREQTESRPS